jgi:hypothetical protein
LVDGVLLNPNENGEAVELPAAAPNAPDVDGAINGVVELGLPPDENDDFGVSAGLFAVDEGALPSLAPKNDDFVAWLGDDAGVVEKGLLVPDPFPLENPLNADFVAAVDGAPPRELVEPNVDPPPVTPNLNLGAVVAAPGDSVAAGNGVDLVVVKPNVGAEGFDDSGMVVEFEEAPRAELGPELDVLFENPKLNLGVGAGVLAVVEPILCGVLVLPKTGVDFVGALAAFAGSFVLLNEPKTDVFLAGSLGALDKPNTDAGFAVSVVGFDEPKTDAAFGGSAVVLSIFPKVNGDPLGMLLGAAEGREAPVFSEGAKPPMRPNNDVDPLPSEA